MKLFYKKRISKFFLFFVFFFLISVSISYKAFAFDVVTSPSPLPTYTPGNRLNIRKTFTVPIYSSDGYIVGNYDMNFLGSYSEDLDSDLKLNIIAGFSLPSNFVINGVTVDRDLIDIMDFSANGYKFYVPTLSDIEFSDGMVVDVGSTEEYDGTYCLLRPVGFSGGEIGELDDYYFYCQMISSHPRSYFLSSFYPSIPENGDPLSSNSVFADVLKNISYKNGIFLDYPLLNGYNTRVHNKYTSGGYGRVFGSILYYSYNSSVTYPLPEYRLVLPYDYLTLSNDDFMSILKFAVQNLKEIKVDLRSLLTSYSDLLSSVSSVSVDVSQILSVVSSMQSLLSSIDSRLSVLGSLNVNLSNINSTLSLIQTALSSIQSSIKDYTNDFKDLKDTLSDVNMNIQNLNKMFSDFSEVSSDILNQFNESMTKLDSIDKKLEDLANSIKAPLPDVNVDDITNSILSEDFTSSTLWIKNILEIPFISIMLVTAFGLMFVSFVFFGKKGS